MMVVNWTSIFHKSKKHTWEWWKCGLGVDWNTKTHMSNSIAPMLCRAVGPKKKKTLSWNNPGEFWLWIIPINISCVLSHSRTLVRQSFYWRLLESLNGFCPCKRQEQGYYYYVSEAVSRRERKIIKVGKDKMKKTELVKGMERKKKRRDRSEIEVKTRRLKRHSCPLYSVRWRLEKLETVAFPNLPITFPI